MFTFSKIDVNVHSFLGFESLKVWSQNNQVVLAYIRSGKPTKKSYIERFNSNYRNELFDMYVFKTLKEIKTMTQDWSNN